ncbi:hypothetical protein IQ06DRAFT_349715 [Phaeosphaeriaceae sp. SRC1lsM3a]|nr:hypothetical protein IQ06DRAFT_349715 [Stagonospora sp. SRC1lsM3a]
MPSLTATYTPPALSGSPQTFSADLPALPPQPSTQERSSLKSVQADVNAFLTDKMEQDKAAGDSKGDDAKDEETYGEEIVDED